MTPHRFSKIEELYHAALGRPPAERERFLHEACGGDEDLLREATSLLGHEEEARRLLEEPVADAATQKLAVVQGTRLGPYEVLDLVGAGGMGEVYRARDTRLGRDVAVKVLPGHVAHDPEALKRFDREARAVAALSHPHIAALFDIGETDGTHYLVMELLEGETLAERLERGALPEKDALRIGAEIAEALGAAHGQGVVHRDVKPANVMLTRAGVKLLDFGLARLPHTTRSPADWATSTTGLGDGVVAGTLPYMAPEQLEGRAVDARADVWALGCVLFEILTGERAFDGDTPARLVAAIEKDEAPSAASQRPGVSTALDRLVRQCLKKDPAERWHSAHDVALRLREIAGSDATVEVRQAARRVQRWALPILAGLTVAALLAGVQADRLWLRPRESGRTPQVVRSHIDLPPGQPLFASAEDRHPARTELAISPDGTLLVWATSPDGDPARSALNLRRLDTGETRRLPGTNGASQPFFSPDGRWIGFSALDQQVLRPHPLRKVPVEGGLAVDLAELASWPMGAWWGADGRILLGSEDGVRWVPAEGGPPHEVTRVDPSREAGHRLPSVLPDGRTMLITVMPRDFGVDARVEAISLASGERRVVAEDAADAHYLPSGHLVFVRQGVLMAAPFDLSRLELTAPPVPVLEGVSQALNLTGSFRNSGAAQVAISDSGLLIYASGAIFEDPPVELLVVDETGRAEPLPGFDKPKIWPDFRFSPNAEQLAFTEQPRNGLLWLFDVRRQTYRVLKDRGMAASPRWSPDGTRIVTSWTEGGPLQLWLLPAGGGDWERLTEGTYHAWAPSWSPDSRFIAFVRVRLPARGDIYLYRFEDGEVVPFVTLPGWEAYPEFSPDGRWLAYGSDDTGRLEVYVTSFPDREQTLTVSRQGGAAPAWSRDGRRLFYCSTPSSGRSSLMAVTVEPGPRLTLGPPTRLFRLPEGFVDLNPMRSYELHPDGRRFVVGRELKTDPPAPITRLEIVHNWFTELERLCPTGRSHTAQETAR